jgi:hypothetical protein
MSFAHISILTFFNTYGKPKVGQPKKSSLELDYNADVMLVPFYLVLQVCTKSPWRGVFVFINIAQKIVNCNRWYSKKYKKVLTFVYNLGYNENVGNINS